MEDTDWRPSPCPNCGHMRGAQRNPVCNNANCSTNQPKKLTDAEVDALLCSPDRLKTEVSTELTDAEVSGLLGATHDLAAAEPLEAWEYEVLQDFHPWEAEFALNQYGEEGWECFNVLPYVAHDKQYVYLFMKRPTWKDND